MYQVPQDTRVLTGVMDTDSARWAVKRENYRHALNLINAYNKEGGSHTNILGTLEVINPYLKSGKNKCIGAFEDVRGGSIIYFVWNQQGYHGIFRWYQNKAGYTNGVIETIYQIKSPNYYTEYNPDPLGFSEYDLITGISLVDDLLFWTVYSSSPKYINIERANETNKKRKWNLYFNDRLFGLDPNPFTHTINIIQAGGAVVDTLSWIMNPTTLDYKGAISELFIAYNSGSSGNIYKLTDKGNYVELEMNAIGVYDVEWTNNSPTSTYSGVCVPENFYPDFTGTVASYLPLSHDLTEQIKFPPFCCPEATFENTDSLGGFFFGLTPYSGNSYINANDIYQAGIEPLNAPYFTDNGYVIAGAGQAISGPFSPNAYITNLGSVPITFKVNWVFTITFIQVSGPIVFPSELNILLQENSVGGNRLNMFTWSNIYTDGNTYTVTGEGYITVNPGDQVYVSITHNNIEFTLDSGTIGAQSYEARTVSDVSTETPQFRAKYIYKEYQHSVYGAISTTAVSKFLFADKIDIDFSDRRLELPELVCDIKNVVLSVSLDSGVTWFDFAKLEPYQFVGAGRQVYEYFGNEVLTAVSEAEAILPYHNVPIHSKSLEYIDDRVWNGGIVIGRNGVPVSLDIAIEYEILTGGEFAGMMAQTPSYSVSRWRRGWKGFIGIVYMDDGDRKSPVCIDPLNSYVEIPGYNDDITIVGNTSRKLNPAYLTVNINNTPPEWATKYHIVRSQDLSQSEYLYWSADVLEYVNDDDSVTNVAPFSGARYIRIDVSNIAYYMDKAYRGTKIPFTFVDGDRVSFLWDNTSTTGSEIYPANEYVIRKVDNTYIYIDFDNSITPRSGNVVCFYTPRPQEDKVLYYEFCACYPINATVQNNILVKSHGGNIQDQQFAPAPLYSDLPAIVECKEGDVWYRSRRFFYDTQTTPTSYGLLINSNTPSDYTEVANDNNGRVNSTEIQGEVYQDTGFVFSDRYITGTQTNGLNAVQPANNRVYSTTYGLLNKMQVINNDILRLIFANGYQLSIYVNQGIIRQSQGAGNIISVVDDVAANSHMIQRTLGTINPESVALNDEGDIFGYDETEGVCWLSAGNGTVDISDTGMSMVWRDYGLARQKLQKSLSHAPAVFDLSTDLYIISLNSIGTDEVLPKAYIKIPDITQDFFSLGGAQVTITINPNNQVVYNAFTNATSWQSILQTAFSGWTLNILNNGAVEVVAPDVANYQDSSIKIVVTYNASFSIPPSASTKTYIIPFKGGRLAGQASPFEGKTLAYNKMRRGWITYFSFVPEMFGRLRNQVVGFVDGKLHLHGNGVSYNNFYGVQYQSLIRYILNNDYPKNKVPLSQWYRGVGTWGCYMRNPVTASYPWGQETQMVPQHFLLEEDGYYAPVMKNRFDPRYPTQDIAWINGEDIRGDSTEIEMYFDGATKARLDAMKTIYLYSENS